MHNALKLAPRLLWRDWRSGQLNLLLLSLILAIATVSSISLFTSRIHNAIYSEAAHLLAADVKIHGTQPLDDAWRRHADALGLERAEYVYFRAMAFAGEHMTLSQVKAVSEAYPLRGELGLSTEPYQPSEARSSGPARGEAWLAPRLFEALQVRPGDTLNIGDAEFRVTASLNREPDSGQSIFGTAPRIMIHLDDVPATGAVQLGSRVDYALLLAGDRAALQRFETEVGDTLGEHHRWQDVNAENRGVGSAMVRAEKFLLLTGCLSVVLSGVAIALSARRYARRQYPQVAILKTLGSGPQQIRQFYLLQLGLIGLGCLLLGAVLGWALHAIILLALGQLLPVDLPAPGMQAYWVGGITGVVALWAFAAPPLFGLQRVPPAAVLRQQSDDVVSARRSFGIGACAMLALMWLFSRDLGLTLIVAAGACVCLFGVGLLGAGLIALARRGGAWLPHRWCLGLTNLQRHQRFNALQIMIFSVLLMLLFILLSVRTSLIAQWQKQLPADTPNHFAFNIFPDDKTALTDFFAQHGIPSAPFYPMTRGRLTAINGEDAQARIAQTRNDVNYERELNLTWSNTLGADNRILEGEWWQESKTEDMFASVEETYAGGIGLQVGDSVTFSIAGQSVTATIRNIRSVQWDSMNPNFFMIFNRPLLEGSGANWITSFYLTSEQKPLLNALLRDFPTVSLIEIDQTLAQVQSIISKVSLAVEFILLLVLASGVLVLITSVQATLDLRIQESAIFRTLGAPRALVQHILLVEFGCLGALAGALASLGTELCLFFLQTQVFELNYQAQWWLWPTGPALGAVLIGSVGWLSTRKVVSTPPLAMLRGIA